MSFFHAVVQRDAGVTQSANLECRKAQIALLMAESLTLTGFDLQGDLNLNICEAHAFNTKDNFSLDVFVVSGWTGQVSFAPWTLCTESPAQNELHSCSDYARQREPGTQISP